MLDFDERRDYTTRPMDIYRCERCGYWEPRHERAVNATPTCDYCCGKCPPGYCERVYHKRSPLSAAVRGEPESCRASDD